MLDLNFVRENLALVKEKLAQRNLPLGQLDTFQEWDRTRRQYITELETRKKKNPSLEVLQRLARAVGVPVTELLE